MGLVGQRVLVMSEKRRARIATTFSLGFHASVLLLIALVKFNGPTANEKLVPIEMILEAPPKSAPKASLATPRLAPVVVPRRGRVAAPRKINALPLLSMRTARVPSSYDKNHRRGYAQEAPRMLTAKGGKAAVVSGTSGQNGLSSNGGAIEEPAGPSYGPSVVGGPLPVYPKNALDLEAEGTVDLTVMVNAVGGITAVNVRKSSGNELLDQAAIRAVRSGWNFVPGMEKGKPAAGAVMLHFEFSGGSVKRG